MNTDDERMPGIEFKMLREYLGLDHDWIADHLGLTSSRQVRRWEAGDAPIPDGVRLQIKAWEDETLATVERTVAALIDLPGPTLTIPLSGVVDGWPARWHRHTAYRVAEQVAGLTITQAQTDSSST